MEADGGRRSREEPGGARQDTTELLGVFVVVFSCMSIVIVAFAHFLCSSGGGSLKTERERERQLKDEVGGCRVWGK